MEEKIKNLENEIAIDREQLSNKSIWLFILAISISSLDACSFLKPLAFAIGLIIYFYYFKLILGERGNISSRYQNLIDEINTNEQKDISSQCLIDKIELSKCKTKEVPIFGYFVFILAILFYMASIFNYFFELKIC